MPSHIRFLSLHAAAGFALALLFVIGLIWSNPGGIGTLLLLSPEWPWPAIWLWFLIGLTFGSALMGGAIMLLGTSDVADSRDESRPEPKTPKRPQNPL